MGEEQVRRVPPGERAATEGVQVEADPLPHPLQEAEEGRLHRRGVQEGHSARGPHHATQEGDEEATRDGGHGRYEEVQGVQHGPPGARGRSTLASAPRRRKTPRPTTSPSPARSKPRYSIAETAVGRVKKKKKLCKKKKKKKKKKS